MKITSNLIGTLLVAAIGTAAFVYMAKRPAVEGNTVLFGAPNKISASTTSKDMQKEEPKQEETVAETTETKVESTENPSPTEATTTNTSEASSTVEDSSNPTN